MKIRIFALALIAVLLVACGGAAAPADEAAPTNNGATILTVTANDASQDYTVDDLRALPATEATFQDVTYVGVTLSELLADAGIDPAGVDVLSAVASDDYSVNYDATIIQRDDVIVAYETADGPLSEDDGTFRMVLPGEEGKMNVRQLVELSVRS